ncbi:hypothetical protein M6C35_002014 [Vibrio metschnikovii]|nr:hypothetical protein [Vibrio metschnikovii]
MKNLIVSVVLMLASSSVSATTTENIVKEFGFSLVDSLVDLQLQTACETHISSTGKQVVTVDKVL